jgi:hypothetical protein
MFFWKCSPKLAISQWGKKKRVEITNLDHKFFHVVSILWQGLKFKKKTFLLTFCQIWLSPLLDDRPIQLPHKLEPKKKEKKT